MHILYNGLPTLFIICVATPIVLALNPKPLKALKALEMLDGSSFH